MVPLNISEVVQIAQNLDCKITHLPITNLGVLHFKKVNRRTLKFFNWEKKKKFQDWKGKLLSICGRLILLNYVISSIPLYWRSIYRLLVHVRTANDKLRKHFFWYRKNFVKKIYCLVS
jgi:hypothetical protein